MHTDDRRTVSGCFLFADHGLTEAAEAILDRCPIRNYRKGELIYSRDCFERAVGVLLSGEADCLTLHAPDGMPEWTLHTGVEPRQLCLLPGGRCLAVAGGLSGEIRLVRLPELTPLRSFPVPGAALCLAVQRGWLYVACAGGRAVPGRHGAAVPLHRRSAAAGRPAGRFRAAPAHSPPGWAGAGGGPGAGAGPGAGCHAPKKTNDALSRRGTGCMHNFFRPWQSFPMKGRDIQ